MTHRQVRSVTSAAERQTIFSQDESDISTQKGPVLCKVKWAPAIWLRVYQETLAFFCLVVIDQSDMVPETKGGGRRENQWHSNWELWAAPLSELLSGDLAAL